MCLLLEDKVPQSPPLAMADSLLRMAALLQGWALAAAGDRGAEVAPVGLAVAHLMEVAAGLAQSQQVRQRQQGDDVQ